ncbi:MAG: BlaI/MecI/CopY family transcriptional regulator [Ruminococcaceae bacterium]|nr:BlaI/MecI/CopY family transcriptional regulator [Oscillospiraceae bacterium]
MSTPKIFESEYRLCLLLWANEPLKCAELARICNDKLTWSRTTTYTVIKRLSDRGVLKVENSVVTSIISKEEAQISELEELIDKKFENNITAFINAFSANRTLTEDEKTALTALLNK